jgi:predicted PurR-regulated permease PerM
MPIVLLTVVVVVAVLRIAQDLFIPLALAVLMTFLLAPLVERLRRLHVKRIFAVVVAVAVGLTVIGALGDVVFTQVTDLARSLPGYQRQLRHNIVELRGFVRGGVSETTKAVEQITRELERVTPARPLAPDVSRVQVVETPPTALETVRDFVVPLLKPVGTALAVIVLVAVMLLRLSDLRERLIRLLGARHLHITTQALNDAARLVSRYLLTQLVINGWTGLCVAAGLWLIGVPNAALWGALTMVLRFIPYIGVWAAAAMPLVLSFAVFDTWTRPLMVVGLFAILELFAYSVLEPWLYGTHTGLSPVALLLAAAFWTWVWGIAGLFLAIPLTVCVAVMGKYIPQLHFLHVLLGDEPVLKPPERLYQRLLASTRDRADHLLQAVLRSKSVLEVCDSVIVPALRLVEADHEQGTLSAARRKTVLQHIDEWAEERFDSLARRRYHAHLQPPGAPSVACVPAADRADLVIAKLLAAALLEQGVDATVVAIEVLEQDVHSPQPLGRWGAVVVSALPPEAVSPARIVCKRVRANSGDMPLIVGLWSDDPPYLERAQQRMETAEANGIVTSFADCLLALRAATMAPAAAMAGARANAESALTQT